jgi:hypothetical protein
MPLADFLASAVEEVGNPAALVTKAQLLRKLNEAAERVTTSMKLETTKVV